MKKGIFSAALLLAVIILGTPAQAQYVNIPDPAFATILQTNYPQCMQGSSLDTTCWRIAQEFWLELDNMGISDLTGIQYFDNLDGLNVNNNNISVLPPLPPSLTYLGVGHNNLTYLPVLPPNLEYIVASFNQITHVEPFTNAMKVLYLQANPQLDSLPPLPSALVVLNLNGDNFTQCPPLPHSLQELSVSYMQLDSLPPLPPGLLKLSADDINLLTLPALPSTLEELRISDNPLNSLPATLPPGLKVFRCSNINLNQLPPLPGTLKELWCDNNNLTTIPELPPIMNIVSIGGNPITCLPQLKKITSFSFSNTNVTCLPNYGEITNSYPSLSTYPLCDPFNNNGCPVFYNISGKVYADVDSNCAVGSQDNRLQSVKVQLFQNGQLLQQAFTNQLGGYSFDVQNTYGTYETRIDTSSFPFSVSCPGSGYYTSVISATDSLSVDNDFGVNCISGLGFDAGVVSITSALPVFRPGSPNTISIKAGDISIQFGAGCIASIPGQVKMVMNGPARITGTQGLPPSSVNGDTIIWNISDMSVLDIDTSFRIDLLVDTNAQLGAMICFDVWVTPTVGDYDTLNNYLNFCYEVVNSFDPNNKTVSPIGNIDTTQQWLYYTVNFQNTGNAPALHVYIMDTLSNYLDWSTIQLLDASHDNYTQVLPNGIVKFNFPNINLPDSVNNEPESHGFVKYKIKLEENLPIGTVIENTAHIYFDFNAPIVTNTTVTTIVGPLPEPTISATSFNGCVGDTITLATAFNAAYTYTWFIDGNSINNSNSNTLEATVLGNYSVQITDGLSSEVSDVQTVTFNPLPVVSFITNGQTLCTYNLPVELLASPAGGTFSGTGVAGQEFIPASAGPGTFNLAYTYSDSNGCTATDSEIFTVNVPQLAFLNLPVDTLCANAQAYDLAPYGSPTGGTFAGGPLSGSMLDISTKGNYELEYIYTDSNSCADTARKELFVDVCNKVGEIATTTIAVYPNPVVDKLTIEVESIAAGTLLVRIMDLSGKVYLSQTINGNISTISLTPLSQGIYVVGIYKDDMLMFRGRIAKMD